MKCYHNNEQFENELIRAKGGECMNNNLFISAKEVAQDLQVSDSYAYRLIRKLNQELEGQGYVIVKGKISRQYFEERVYGMKMAQ